MRALAAVLLFAAVASGQDRTLDLPLEKPAPVSSVTPASSSPIGRWREPEKPRVLEAPAPEDPPPHFYGHEIRSQNQSVFFVIDMSGSMGYDVAPYTDADGNTQNGTRLDRAKAELTRCIALLPEHFTLNLLAYDCDSRQWRDDMQPANADNKASAIAWERALEPGGGTGTGYAVAQVLRQKSNRLIELLTDGAPNCYLGGLCGSDDDMARHLEVIRQANTQGAMIDVFGIGATGQFKRFCEDIATQNGGTYVDCR